MKWQEVSVKTNQDNVEIVANMFHENGSGGVVIEDPFLLQEYLKQGEWSAEEAPELLNWRNIVVKGYFPIDENLETRLTNFKNIISYLPGAATLTLAEVVNEDWAQAWKAYYKPQIINKRLIVSPAWENINLNPEQIAVYLEPGMAFGSGTHPTTLMCLRLIDKYVKSGDQVVDVGTGSGILAITAAKLGAGKVLAVDNDPIAIKTVWHNIKINQVSEVVTVREGNLLEGVKDNFRVVVANILADTVITLGRSVIKVLEPCGYYLASGIILDRLDTVIKELTAQGFLIKEVAREGEWAAVVAGRD